MEFKVGDKVHTVRKKFASSKSENGVIKRIDDVDGVSPLIFVVFHCNDDWGNYSNYTGILCSIEDLRLGWIEDEEKEKKEEISVSINTIV